MNKAALPGFYFISLMAFDIDAVGGEVLGVHTHGIANLTLAFENGSMEVQFESPAMSLLGFEHTPKTKKQIETVKTTKAFLKTPANVLSIQGTDCFANKVVVNILGPAGESLPDKHRQQHGHGHQQPGDQHRQHETSQEAHSEVSATYQFDCSYDQMLQSITIVLFKHFDSLEEIKVNWVTETQQGEDILRPQASIIEFR